MEAKKTTIEHYATTLENYYDTLYGLELDEELNPYFDEDMERFITELKALMSLNGKGELRLAA